MGKTTEDINSLFLRTLLGLINNGSISSVFSNIQHSVTKKSVLDTVIISSKDNLFEFFEENKNLRPLISFFTLKELFLKQPSSFEKTTQKIVAELCYNKAGFDLKLFKKLLKFVSSSFHEIETKKHYVIDVSDTTSFTSNLHVQTHICMSFLSVFDDNYSYFPNEEEDFSLSMEIGEYTNMIRYCCDSNISNKNVLIDFLASRFLNEKYDAYGTSFNTGVRGIIIYYGASTNWNLVINANIRTVSYYLNLCKVLKTDRDKDNNYNVEADKCAFAYIESTMNYYKDVLKTPLEMEKLWKEYLPKIRTLYKTQVIYYYYNYEKEKLNEFVGLIETNIKSGFYPDNNNAYHRLSEIKEFVYHMKKSLSEE